MKGIEKRKQERFSLHVPVNIRCQNNDTEITDGILTKDISSKGVLINSKNQNLQTGEKVHLEMTLTIDKLKELFSWSEKITLKVDGSIIRSKDEEVAIEFDKNYSIFPEIFRTD